MIIKGFVGGEVGNGVPSFYFTTNFLSNQPFSVLVVKKISVDPGFQKFFGRPDRVVRVPTFYRVADFKFRLILRPGHSFLPLSIP